MANTTRYKKPLVFIISFLFLLAILFSLNLYLKSRDSHHSTNNYEKVFYEPDVNTEFEIIYLDKSPEKYLNVEDKNWCVKGEYTKKVAHKSYDYWIVNDNPKIIVQGQRNLWEWEDCPLKVLDDSVLPNQDSENVSSICLGRNSKRFNEMWSTDNLGTLNPDQINLSLDENSLSILYNLIMQNADSSNDTVVFAPYSKATNDISKIFPDHTLLQDDLCITTWCFNVFYKNENTLYYTPEVYLCRDNQGQYFLTNIQFPLSNSNPSVYPIPQELQAQFRETFENVNFNQSTYN